MQNVKDALLREVDVCREMLKLHDAFASCGYYENPYWDNFSTAADGIYKLIGEHTETFEESITYLVLTAPYLTNGRRAEMLYAEYQKHNPVQEAPNADSGTDTPSITMKQINDAVNKYSITRGRPQDKVALT